jgi:pentatricopeptide repeat protein
MRLANNLDHSLGDSNVLGEPAWRGKLRSNIRHLLCSLGQEKCVSKARDVFARWMKSKTHESNILSVYLALL